MRRIWAYIVAAFTTLVVVSAAFINQGIKIHSNNQFEDGREITFRVSYKDGDVADPENPNEAVDNIAKVMKDRLEVSKITSYEVLTVGYDTVKVRLSQQSNDDYNKISTFLSFNGSLGLTYGDTFKTASEFLRDADAYVDSYNGYPAIVLPIEKKEVEPLIQAATDDSKNSKFDYAEEGQKESEESTPTYNYYMYLWYDFEVDQFNDKEWRLDQTEYNERLVMKFLISVDSESSLPQYFDSKENSLFSLINLDANGDGVASADEKNAAYTNARYFVNLINAGALDYDVRVMFSERIGSTIETLVGFGALSWNQMLPATLCTIVVLILMLVIFYRLGAVGIGTITISSTFLAFLTTIWFAAEFNVVAIFGLIAVAIASLSSGAIYMAKLKAESYRGRSIKKANTEAGKHALLPTIDIHVVVIVAGIFAYVFGGAIFRAFGAITVLGGLMSLVLNLFGLRGLMWLVTNDTSIEGKYGLFGINAERVPDLIKEEKQTYFGAYADKDFSKRSKLVTILTSILFVGTLAGSITFASLNGNNAFVNKKTTYTTQMIFESQTSSPTGTSELDENSVYDLLSHMYLYDIKEDGSYVFHPIYVAPIDGEPSLENMVIDFVIPTPSSRLLEGVTVTYYYYIVKLNKAVSTDALGVFVDADNPTEAQKIAAVIEGETLNDTLLDKFGELGYESTTVASLKAIKTSDQSYIKYGNVGLAVGVALAVIGLYFVIRYRLSRGLAMTLLTTGVTGVIMGLLSITRLAVSSYVLAAVPAVAMFACIIALFYMNRERELILEDRNHDNSRENRKAISIKATGYAFSATSALTILIGWLSLGYFGFGPEGIAWAFALLFLGVVFTLWVLTVLYAPACDWFYKLFKKVHINRKPRKEKKIKVRNKSAEPEEAVFIGIND